MKLAIILLIGSLQMPTAHAANVSFQDVVRSITTEGPKEEVTFRQAAAFYTLLPTQTNYAELKRILVESQTKKKEITITVDADTLTIKSAK